jgi:hypothetical protein
MTTDRRTKVLLLAIAIGLWANVATQWLRPKALLAQNVALDRIDINVGRIASDVGAISTGLCLNRKIC